MKPNRYIQVGTLTNSCLISANAYRVLSGEAEFAEALLEEITDPIRQSPGRSYMRVRTVLDSTELWMVPFSVEQKDLPRLQNAMERICRNCLGREHFYFPFDVVEEDGQTAYLMRPIKREESVPLRKFLPDAAAERWNMSISLFRRVLELKQMGVTSNGISREQLRVCRRTGQVKLWLNETVSFAFNSDRQPKGLRHEGFLSLPAATENGCAEANISINGTQRDIFSAAVVAFYLIMYTHPFIGSGFYSLLRDDYLTHYHNFPEYIMAPGGSNSLGNQLFSRVVEDQWSRTVPQLQALFDGLFMAVTDPKTHWKANADYWKTEKWIEALELDAGENDNAGSRSDFHFNNERYHQV